MIGALYNGLSGLDSFQKALNTQSNNMANVNTIGYKADQISFGDMMYQDGVGKGAAVTTIQKNFNQGELKVTDNSYDIGLQGDGFFQVSSLTDDSVYYSRAGNFKVGKDGTLQTTDYRDVLGSAMNAIGAGDVVATDANYTQFSSLFDRYIASQSIYTDTEVSTVNVKTSNLESTVQSDDSSLSGQGYKSSGIKMADVDKLSAAYRDVLYSFSQDPQAPSTASVYQVEEYTFDGTQLDDESDTLKIFIENDTISQQFETDSATTLNSFADKLSAIPGLSASVDSTTGVLTITNMIPGENVNINSASLNDVAVLPGLEQVGVMGTGQGAVDSMRDALKTAVERTSNEAMFLEITTSIDRFYRDPTGTYTNPATGKLDLKLDTLGISFDPHAEFEVDENGVVMMNQDGSRFVVGQIAISSFNDPLSLEPIGSNLFASTQNSGEPTVVAGTIVFHQGAVELSNATLAEDLTSLMVYQRAYEANAKAITTSDEFLNIAIQLKK
ncbi:MAG: flagellar hook-basal body complex protein [Campylobacterota bacterium]|nr:flagellar hook-basal body complex protein [Campylobacterota bacterium]